MKTEKKSFIKNTMIILAFNGLTLITSFLLRPLIARFIGPEQYGIFALILSTAAVIPALTLLSLNSAILYFVSKHHADKKIIGQIIFTSVSFVTASSILLFIPLLLIMPNLVAQITFWPFLVAYLLAFINVLFYIVQAVQQGKEEFRSFSLTGFLSTFSAGVLSVGTAYFFTDATFSALWRAIGMMLIVAAAFLTLTLAGSFSKNMLKKMFRYSAPLAIGAIIGSTYAVLDRYFIARFHSLAEVGYYDVSFSLIIAILPVATTFFTVMAPRIIRQTRSFPAYFKNVSLATCTIVTAFGLAAYYFSDIIVTLLLGSVYLPATPMIKILALSLPFMAFFGLMATSLNSLGKTKLCSALAILLTGAIIATNLLLTEKFGGIGAAWATFASYAFISAIGITYFRAVHHVHIRNLAIQLALFFLFAAGYHVAFEPFGFKAKAAAYALFLILTLYTQRELTRAILKELNWKALLKK